ncbi:carbohydrate ABC transporter permease [Lentzea indica]|uniref:carbohydrate ABC transporter permease n=1 Tax=Lentzea indica TaxID=2604800 RepID=UPI0028A76CF2|nr:sugar ABC transporter permease [Lentzea indica]
MTVLRERPAPARPAPSGSSSLTASQRRFGRDWRLAAVFIGPTLLLVAALILFPIVSSIFTSTTERHGAETVFVGLDNYTALLGDTVFHKGVLNSFVFTAYAEIFKVTLGLIAALMLHHMRRGRAIIAGVILLPWVVPTVVTAFTWRSLFDPIFGSVNVLLTDSGIGPALAAVGLVDRWPAEWLSDPALAMPAVILVNVWKGIPFFTVTFLAGLKAIDSGLYEAAIVDGASPWQRFKHITLPGLRHVMIVTVLLSSIWTFNNFDLIWLMTQGGPGDATAPYVMVAYSKAIQQLQLGAGAAVTLVMLPIIGILVVILVRMMRRSDLPGTGDLGRRRLTPAQRRAMPWVIVAASVLVLVWASPHIVWKAALVLGVFVVLAAAVGRVVSTLAARAAGWPHAWSAAPARGSRSWVCWASCSPRSTG